MFRNKAFTFSETLIMLAILGLIAAITIPNVIKHYKRNILKTQLKQAYSDVEQLSRMFTVIHNGTNLSMFHQASNPPYMRDSMLLSEIANNNYIKIRDLKNFSAAFPNGIVAQAELVSFIETNYKTLIDLEISSDLMKSGYLKDGKNRDWFFYVTNAHEMLITIDINGVEKKPNRWGQDLFTFVVEPENGEVIFHSSCAQCTVCKNSKGVGTGGGTSNTADINGLNCTEYAYRDVHPTDPTKIIGKTFWISCHFEYNFDFSSIIIKPIMKIYV